MLAAPSAALVEMPGAWQPRTRRENSRPLTSHDRWRLDWRCRGYRWPNVSEICPDLLTEAQRLLSLADTRGVPLRLIGGVAVRLRAGGCFPERLVRSYGDLDFMSAKGASGSVGRLLGDAGYEGDRPFNALEGKHRLIFYDLANQRKIDVFLGEFSMCHRIPVGQRISVDPVSIPLAELLLTKLQVVQLNEKDLTDTLALLAAHEVAATDGDAVNGARIASLCASDWGLWRTITANLRTCRERAGDYELGDVQERVVERIDALLDWIDVEPKTRRWGLRARVGERVRWYELPEEVEQEA